MIEPSLKQFSPTKFGAQIVFLKFLSGGNGFGVKVRNPKKDDLGRLGDQLVFMALSSRRQMYLSIGTFLANLYRLGNHLVPKMTSPGRQLDFLGI